MKIWIASEDGGANKHIGFATQMDCVAAVYCD